MKCPESVQMGAGTGIEKERPLHCGKFRASRQTSISEAKVSTFFDILGLFFQVERGLDICKHHQHVITHLRLSPYSLVSHSTALRRGRGECCHRQSEKLCRPWCQCAVYDEHLFRTIFDHDCAGGLKSCANQY